MSALDELREAVQRNADATASAAELIKGLAAKIREANDPEGDDPEAEIEALAAELEAQADRLAAAVVGSGGQASTSQAPQDLATGGTGNGEGPSTTPPTPAPPPPDSSPGER